MKSGSDRNSLSDGFGTFGESEVILGVDGERGVDAKRQNSAVRGAKAENTSLVARESDREESEVILVGDIGHGDESPAESARNGCNAVDSSVGSVCIPQSTLTGGSEDALCGTREGEGVRFAVERGKRAHGAAVARRGGISGDWLGERAVREVLGLEVALLPKLASCTLMLRCANGAAFVITTSRSAFARAKSSGVPVFVGGELIALAMGAQNDRVFPCHVEAFVARKTRNPGWRLTNGEAIGISNAEPLTWTFAELCERIGVALEGVEVRR